MAKGQRPKNNHNKRITGIGTPSSQSRSPRPIFASIIRSIQERGSGCEDPASGMETSVVSASNWRVMPLDHVGADTERVGSWPTERFADGHKDRAIRIMPKYKLAIFDLDGTLSDSLPWFRRVVNSIADKHGVKRIEDQDVEMLRGKSSREIIR